MTYFLSSNQFLRQSSAWNVMRNYILKTMRKIDQTYDRIYFILYNRKGLFFCKSSDTWEKRFSYPIQIFLIYLVGYNTKNIKNRRFYLHNNFFGWRLYMWLIRVAWSSRLATAFVVTLNHINTQINCDV